MGDEKNRKSVRVLLLGICVITGLRLTTAVLHGLTCNALVNHHITCLLGFGGTHLFYFSISQLLPLLQYYCHAQFKQKNTLLHNRDT